MLNALRYGTYLEDSYISILECFNENTKSVEDFEDGMGKALLLFQLIRME